MTYLPLPENITLKQSKVHGMGLFAKSKILKDTSLGLSHINIEGYKVMPEVILFH